MTSRTASPRASEKTADPVFRVVVLHDDHVTARRGTLVARGIAHDMGVGDSCETALWNIDLFDTLFGRDAAIDASMADIVIVALCDSAGFSADLKTWLGRWLIQKKGSSAALIVVFENNHAPGAKKARTFVERAAHSVGRDCFSQPAETSPSDEDARAHEFLWVL